MSKVFWTQKQDMGPSARYGHAMAFDSANGHTVMFGGFANGSAVGDTWEWDGNDWTQVQDMGPAPRVNAAMAFDSVRGRAVLFGGAPAAGAAFGDTWEWDGNDWTQVQDMGPSARFAHAVAFDSKAQLTLLFGGRAAGGNTGDTWTWDGNDWTQVEDTGPLPRSSHAIAFAADRARAVLFGGYGANAVLADTWEWDGSKWTEIQDVGPNAREGAAMAFTGGSIVLTAGFNGDATNTGKFFGDTWEWDGAHWTERQDIGPEGRWQHAMVFDGPRTRLVVFGGTTAAAGQSQLGDTWECPMGAPPPPAPAAAAGVTMSDFIVAVDKDQQLLLGQVDLTGPAPAGAVIHVSSDRNIGTVLAILVAQANGVLAATGQQLPGPPWSVPVQNGSTQVLFAIETAQATAGPVQLTATLGSASMTAATTI